MNSVGSYQCLCVDGYHEEDNGGCKPISECSVHYVGGSRGHPVRLVVDLDVESKQYQK